MKTNSSLITANRKEHGFTLIELMVAIAVASILGFLAVQALGGQQDTARAGSARSFFIEDLPSALTSYGSANGQNAQVSDASDLYAYGVPADTAWGETWTVDSAGTSLNGITIVYPVGGSNPDKMGDNIATLLTSNNVNGDRQFPYVASASYADGKLTTTIRQF